MSRARLRVRPVHSMTAPSVVRMWKRYLKRSEMALSVREFPNPGSSCVKVSAACFMSGSNSFRVEFFEVVEIGEQHVVALVHGYDGADSCTGFGIAAWHADVVASVGTLG